MTFLTVQQPTNTRTKQKVHGQSIPKIPAIPNQRKHKSPYKHYHRAKIHFLVYGRKKTQLYSPALKTGILAYWMHKVSEKISPNI